MAKTTVGWMFLRPLKEAGGAKVPSKRTASNIWWGNSKCIFYDYEIKCLLNFIKLKSQLSNQPKRTINGYIWGSYFGLRFSYEHAQLWRGIFKKIPPAAVCVGGRDSRFARVSLALDPVSHGVGAGKSPDRKSLKVYVKYLALYFFSFHSQIALAQPSRLNATRALQIYSVQCLYIFTNVVRM